jgi:hypothetical protein
VKHNVTGRAAIERPEAVDRKPRAARRGVDPGTEMARKVTAVTFLLPSDEHHLGHRGCLLSHPFSQFA